MSTTGKLNPDIEEYKPKLKQRQKVVHKLRAIIRISKALIYGALFYGIYLLWNLPFWNIENVEFSGLSSMGYRYIEKFDLKKNYLNQHLLSINPYKIKMALENERVFREVSVNRSLFPSTVQINFKERVPYLTIYDSKKESDVTIDDEGVVLTYTKKGKNILNFAINDIKNNKITYEQLNDIRVIDSFIKSKKIPDVKVFDLSNPNNIILNTEKNKILLGDLEEFVMKIRTISQLETLSKNTKNELEYIDVRYWKNPVLKVKESSD